MHEQQPQTPQPDQPWSSRQIAEALGVPARSQQSELGGRGARFDVGDHTTLEVYPQRKIVRVRLPGASIELTRQEPPTIRDGSVIFKTEASSDRDREQRELGLSVSRTGEVFFAYMEPVQPDASEAPESAQEPAPAPKRQQASERRESAPSADLRSPQTLSTAPPRPVGERGVMPVATTPPDASSQTPQRATTAFPAPKREEDQVPAKSGWSGHPGAKEAIPGQPVSARPERVPHFRLSGEVKRVSYREPTEQGKAPSLQLTIAHQEGEQRRLTRVYTTKERARQFKDVAQIGDQVSIVGLPQQQTRRLSDGTEREETVVYALGIKRVTPQGNES